MTRPVRSLWRLLAALLLLATVPAAAILPPPAPPRPAPVELGAEVLERLDQAAGDVGDVVAVALAVCELHPAKPPRAGALAPALARWGPKPHVGAFGLARGKQHQAIQWFSCEIAVALSYDADGVRVRSEVVPAGGGGGGAVEVTEYLVDTSGPLSQVVVEGSTTAAVGAVYVRGDDLLAVLRPAGGGGGGGGGGAGGMVARFYHADGLGSVRALTDEAGGVTDRWDFSAFGELLSHVGDDPQAYLFAGEALDPNVGWYYNRARWMDPRVGRFGSVDPWAGDPSSPATLHRYLYGSLDPVNRIDPSGLRDLFSLAVGSVLQSGLAIARAATVRLYWAVQLSLGRAILWYFNNTLKVELFSILGPLALAGALEFTDHALERLANNADPVPYEPGDWIEQKVGANATDYEIIDDFRDGAVTSFKSNRQNQTRLLRAITREAETLGNRQAPFQPRASAPVGTLPIPTSSVLSRVLVMVIPEEHAVYFNSATFRMQVAQIARDTRVLIRVVPLRGWRVR